jgi:hypothetical protein
VTEDELNEEMKRRNGSVIGSLSLLGSFYEGRTVEEARKIAERAEWSHFFCSLGLMLAIVAFFATFMLLNAVQHGWPHGEPADAQHVESDH